MPDVSSCLDEHFCDPMVVLLDCDAEGSFSLGCDDISIRLLAEQQLEELVDDHGKSLLFHISIFHSECFE